MRPRTPQITEPIRVEPTPSSGGRTFDRATAERLVNELAAGMIDPLDPAWRAEEIAPGRYRVALREPDGYLVGVW